jgi:predicted nuclease of restriction endonuclease-like (RecB) superfamily
MWNIVGSQNCLNNNWKRPRLDETISVLDTMLTSIRSNIHQIPKENYCEVKFEELEKDPLNSLKNIYKSLNLDFEDQLEEKIKQFLLEIKTYSKNEYKLSAKEEELIKSKLKNHMDYYGYS